MTNENLELSIKKSFENIVPDSKKKEEIYNKLISEMSAEKDANPSFFSKFTEKLPRIMPYAVVCACLLLVIGITFAGGFDYVLSKNGAETAAYSLETIYESTSYAADAELIEDRMMENEAEIPETAKECIADDCETVVNKQFYVIQEDGTHCTFAPISAEFNPATLWERYLEFSPVLKPATLIAYEMDEAKKIITLNFGEELKELIKTENIYNHFIAAGETYKSFFPEYRFIVNTNGQALIIDNSPVNFLNHTYKTEK